MNSLSFPINLRQFESTMDDTYLDFRVNDDLVIQFKFLEDKRLSGHGLEIESRYAGSSNAVARLNVGDLHVPFRLKKYDVQHKYLADRDVTESIFYQYPYWNFGVLSRVDRASIDIFSPNEESQHYSLFEHTISGVPKYSSGFSPDVYLYFDLLNKPSPNSVPFQEFDNIVTANNDDLFGRLTDANIPTVTDGKQDFFSVEGVGIVRGLSGLVTQHFQNLGTRVTPISSDFISSSEVQTALTQRDVSYDLEQRRKEIESFKAQNQRYLSDLAKITSRGEELRELQRKLWG